MMQTAANLSPAGGTVRWLITQRNDSNNQ